MTESFLKKVSSISELREGQAILLVSFNRHDYSEFPGIGDPDPRGWVVGSFTVKEFTSIPERAAVLQEILEDYMHPRFADDFAIADKDGEIVMTPEDYPILVEVFLLSIPDGGVDRNG